MVEPQYLNDIARVARIFVRTKGMPKDPEELVEWLVQFAGKTGELYDYMVKLFENHMMICNSQPTIVRADTQCPPAPTPK